MKINVSAEWNGSEILEAFLNQLKSNNIDANPNDIQILIQSKDKEINLTPDRIKLSYIKTQV